MKTIYAFLIVLIICLIAGCTLRPISVKPSKESCIPRAENFPALWSLEATSDKKTSSAQRASGSQYLAPFKSANATVNGTELELPAQEKTIAWAIYRLHFFAADPPTAIEINLKSTAALWVAVGDYKLKSWNWSMGKLSGSNQYKIELAPIKQVLSPKNNFHLAVVADGENVTVTSIKGITAGIPTWNMYGGNRRHTSQSEFKGPVNPEIIWQTDMDEGYNAPVIDKNGDIYFLTATSKLYSVNSINGSINWVFNAAGTSFCSPTVDSERKQVYFGDRTGVFYAVNTETGKENWRKTHSGQVTTAVALANDGTVIYNQGVAVWALNPDGSLKWAKNDDSKTKTGVAIGDDDTVYFGNFDAPYAFALNPDGTTKWATQTGSGLQGLPTVNLEYVYFPGVDKKLYVLKASDGSIVNVSDFGNNSFGGAASIALDNSVIIPTYGSSGGSIYVFKPDGTLLGSSVLPGKSIPPLLIDSEGIYYLPVFGDSDEIIAVDPTSQKLRWNLPFTDVNSCLLIGPGNVLYIHVNSSLIAIGDKIG